MCHDLNLKVMLINDLCVCVCLLQFNWFLVQIILFKPVTPCCSLKQFVRLIRLISHQTRDEQGAKNMQNFVFRQFLCQQSLVQVDHY